MQRTKSRGAELGSLATAATGSTAGSFVVTRPHETTGSRWAREDGEPVLEGPMDRLAQPCTRNRQGLCGGITQVPESMLELTKKVRDFSGPLAGFVEAHRGGPAGLTTPPRRCPTRFAYRGQRPKRPLAAQQQPTSGPQGNSGCNRERCLVRKR